MDSSSSSDSEGDDLIQYLARSRLTSREAKPQPSSILKSKGAPRRFLANIRWRSFSTDELRSHPLYRALPETSSVRQLETPADLAHFRQGSRQWEALHPGRLTTSKAAACLGFYEPQAAATLGVPKFLRRHTRAVDACLELRKSALGPEEWGKLVDPPEPAPVQEPEPTAPKAGAEDLSPTPCWGPVQPPPVSPATSNSTAHFACAHLPARRWISPAEKRSVRDGSLIADVQAARRAWGTAQEPTALLTCLNVLHERYGTSAELREVGLMALEAWPGDGATAVAADDGIYGSLREMQLAGLLPPIGASPDGLAWFQHAREDPTTGTGAEFCEVVEVKCHSPFTEGSSGGVSVFGTVPGAATATATLSIGSWHIPQLQLEMLCAGPRCRAALYVGMTAMGGASVFRIKRDDAYISQMIHWLSRFYTTYVKAPVAGATTPLPPPPPPVAAATTATLTNSAPSSSSLPQPKSQSKKKGKNGKTKSITPAQPQAPRLPAVPANVFWTEPSFRPFLQKTAQLAAGAELVAKLPQGAVQRADRDCELLVPENPPS